MRAWTVCLAGAMALGAASQLERFDFHARGIDHAGLSAHDTHAAASIIGQFRTSISAWLWLRSDLYVHGGVSMRPMTNAEMNRGLHSSDAHSKEDEHWHGVGNVTTVVPSQDQDHRGLLGDIERATSTYKDMSEHSHDDAAAILPLIRLMTWIDPQFVPAWVVGGSVLANSEKRSNLPKAFAFLHEGREHNPRSVAILAELGRLSLVRNSDATKGIAYLSPTRSLISKRLLDDENEAEAALTAYRFLALAYREKEDFAEMREVAQEGLSWFPDDAPLTRMSKMPPTPLAVSHWRSYYRWIVQ